jgi:hypothetical protein
MKLNLIAATIAHATLLMSLATPATVFSQAKRTPGALGRAEYIEVEPNVKLHVTD